MVIFQKSNKKKLKESGALEKQSSDESRITMLVSEEVLHEDWNNELDEQWNNI